MDNTRVINKSIINRIADNQNAFFRTKLTLAGVEEKSTQNDKGEIIKWAECLVINGTAVAHINTGFDSGIFSVPIYKEYEFALSYDDATRKLRIVGIFGVPTEKKN